MRTHSVALRLRLLPPAALASAVLFLLCTGAIAAFAQQNQQPQSINISAFRRPSNLSPSELEQLRGNCCLPYVSVQQPGSYNPANYQVECFSQVGIPGSTDPVTGLSIQTAQDQINACTNFALQAGYPTALHYNFENVHSCDFQCGRDLKLLYCDLSEEAPTCRQDLSEGTDMSNVIAYPVEQLADCQAACHPPVDVQVSVGCACSTTMQQNNATTAWNLCTVYARQDPADGPTYPVQVQSIRAMLDWAGTDPQRMTPVSARVLHRDGTFADLRWVQDGGDGTDFAITDVTIPAGDFFKGTFFVPAPDVLPADGFGLFLGEAVSTGDPNIFNDQDTTTIANLATCRSLTLDSQCMLDGAAATLDTPFLYHNYTLNLTQYAGQAVQLNILADPPGCFSADPADVIGVPEGCTLDGNNWDGPGDTARIRLIECANFTVDATDPVLSFFLYPRESNACPTFTPMTLTASIHIGNRSPTELDVTQAKKPCGQCEVCQYAVDANGGPSEAACRDPNNVFSRYCKWIGNACVADEDNPVCPSFYGCCQLVSDTGEDTGTSGENFYQYIAGTRVEQGFFLPDEEAFNRAKQCYDDTVIDAYRQKWPFSPVVWSPDDEAMDWIGDGTGQGQYTTDADVYYWKRICEEVSPDDTQSNSSQSASAQTGQQPRPWVYFCGDAFNEEYYRVIATQQGTTINEIPPPDCDVYSATNPDHDLGKGTIYYPGPYTPVFHPGPFTPAAESLRIMTPLVDAYVAANPGIVLIAQDEVVKYSCPRTCEISTRNRITCGRNDGCEVTTIGACRGGMTYPVGQASMALCERRRLEGAFNPVPREFRP